MLALVRFVMKPARARGYTSFIGDSGGRVSRLELKGTCEGL
jgi:hypothetical protein